MLHQKHIHKVLQELSRHISRKAQSQVVKTIVAQYQRNKDEKLLFGGVLETKKEKKKREKTQKKSGTAVKSVAADAPDSEAYWLSNITSQDLKVYRKTTSGRYKEVNKDKLSVALNVKIKEISSSSVPQNLQLKVGLPEILINKLTKIPMLAPKADSGEVIIDPSDVLQFPSVTRILSDTMSDSSKAALDRWKAKMVAELGEEGFAIHNREQLSFGARFHSCVRKYLESAVEEVDDDLHAVWASVQRVLSDVSQVQLLEANVAHPVLKYKGIVDCVASFQNNPSVIEWKVSEKLKPHLSNTYDAPLQLSAYLGALSYDRQHLKHLRHGVVVVAYKDGSPAQVFPLNENSCTRHWNQWVQRVQQYWKSVSSQSSINKESFAS